MQLNSGTQPSRRDHLECIATTANESFSYDTNRLQLTSQVATKNGGSTGGLINLTYGYQASAGQMCAGSTAGNAGQLMAITSSTIGGTTESAGYTYDLVGRLVTSNQTSNSSSAQRRFAYDRWGNRIGVWGATSGGTQIQSISLAQSGGAPTNRITSVTSGSTWNYSYDAVGNFTNDGVHTYTYDAPNRVVSVDSGSTAQYNYRSSEPTSDEDRRIELDSLHLGGWAGNRRARRDDGVHDQPAVSAKVSETGLRLCSLGTSSKDG